MRCGLVKRAISSLAVFTFPVLAMIAATVALGACWSLGFLRGQPVALRILFAVSSLGLAGILLRVVGLTAFSPLREWNGARLAPLMAFERGVPLYGDPASGVLSAWIYGPIPALVYLPTSLLHEPTGCIILGVIQSELMFFAPEICAIGLAWRRIGSAGRMIGPLMLAVLFCIALRNQSLIDGAFFILSDAPAMALIISACILLMGRRSPPAVAVSAVLTVLACWCKQTIVPLAIVPVLFLLLAEEREAATTYIKWLLCWGAAISAVLVWQFGARAMWFNMVTIPSRQPFRYGGQSILPTLCYGLWEWMKQAVGPALPMMVLLTMAALIPSRAPTPRTSSRRLGELCRRRPWIILILASGSLLLPSVLGFIKTSGDYNNFALSQFPLLLAGCLGIVDLWPELTAARPVMANVIAAIGCSFVFVCGVTADATRPGALDAISAQLSDPSASRQQIIFNFERLHPGVGYFPWEPLPALLAEGKLYHFEWGFIDRITANLPPSSEQAMAHVPTKMQFIAIPTDATIYALKFFPRFTVSGEVPMLPGFTVFSIGAPSRKGSTMAVTIDDVKKLLCVSPGRMARRLLHILEPSQPASCLPPPRSS